MIDREQETLSALLNLDLYVYNLHTILILFLENQFDQGSVCGENFLITLSV